MFETLNDLERRVLDLIKKYSSIKNEHKNVLAQHDSLKNAHQDLLSRIPSMQTLQTQIAELSELKAQNSQLLSERQQTQIKLAEVRQLFDALSLEQKNVVAENVRLKEEIEQMRLNMQSAEHRIGDLLSSIATDTPPANATMNASENPPSTLAASGHLDPFAELIDEMSQKVENAHPAEKPDHDPSPSQPRAHPAPESPPHKPAAMTFTAPTFQLPQ